MKSGVRYINLLGVFLISWFSAGATTDTLQLAKSADSLFRLEHYYEAGNFYQKASYYCVSQKNKISFLLQKVNCLKQQGLFSDAEAIIASVNTDLPDTLLNELLSQGALCSYLGSQYVKAESYLVTLDYKLSDRRLMNSNLVLYSLVLNEQARWAEAKEKLKSYINNNPLFDSVIKVAYVDEINILYNSGRFPKLKNPKKAKTMSHIIPGLGQMYAGYFGEGLSSLALNTITLAGAAVGIYFQYYFTSIVLGNYFFAKFYLGNVSRAEFLANKRNYLRINKFNSELKPKILKLYQ